MKVRKKFQTDLSCCDDPDCSLVLCSVVPSCGGCDVMWCCDEAHIYPPSILSWSGFQRSRLSASQKVWHQFGFFLLIQFPGWCRLSELTQSQTQGVSCLHVSFRDEVREFPDLPSYSDFTLTVLHHSVSHLQIDLIKLERTLNTGTVMQEGHCLWCPKAGDLVPQQRWLCNNSRYKSVYTFVKSLHAAAAKRSLVLLISQST